MKRIDLIYAVAIASNISKAAAERTVDAATDAIMKAVASGDTVRLSGFGTFKASRRSSRAGTNPRTGEAIDIAARTVPRFTAGRAFKSLVATRHPKQR